MEIKAWHIFAIILILLVFVNIWSTVQSIRQIDKTIKNKAELLGYKFLMLYTKVLQIMEFYYFSALLVQMKVSNILQMRVVKIINLMISISLTCRLGFTAANTTYLVLQTISFFYISLIVIELNPYMFHKYNKSISADINILKRHILYEVIGGCKTVAYIFLGLLMLAHITFAPVDGYLYYSTAKCLVFFIDNVLSRGRLDNFVYNISSLILIGGLSVFSVMYVTYLFMVQSVLEKLAYIFNELVLLLWFIFLLLFFYMEWKSKRN